MPSVDQKLDVALLAPIPHLLATQAWLWFFNQDLRARKLAGELPSTAHLGIAAITVWEAAMLEAKGCVRFQPNLGARVREMETKRSCALIPLLPEIAISSTRIEALHGDPSNRIIVATALHTGATLVTSDGKILAWAAAVPGRLSVLTI